MSVSRIEQESPRRLVLERFTPFRIVALGHAMGERLKRAYADENIGIKEWRVLAVIAQADAVAARDVVARTPMDKMSVSRAIASLEGKRLAERAVSASDRRVNMVSLTADGRALFDRVAAKALAYEDSLLSSLSPEERAGLDRALEKLSRNANPDGKTRAP